MDFAASRRGAESDVWHFGLPRFATGSSWYLRRDLRISLAKEREKSEFVWRLSNQGRRSELDSA